MTFDIAEEGDHGGEVEELEQEVHGMPPIGSSTPESGSPYTGPATVPPQKDSEDNHLNQKDDGPGQA